MDRKPPMLPWLYQGAFALFGDRSLWPLKVAAAVAVLAGAVLLASLARRRWGSRAGWIAGVCYVLASVGLVPEDTQAATFEVFMLPWTVLAMWSADRGRWAWAGLGIAGAVLTKQTGGAVLIPVLWLLWRSRAGWWASSRLAGAAVLPVLAVALAYGPGRFLFWMATGSGSYASVDGAGAHALVRALANGGLLALGCLPPVLALLYVLRTRRPLTPTRMCGCGWRLRPRGDRGVPVLRPLLPSTHPRAGPVGRCGTTASADAHPRHARRLNAVITAGFLAWAWLAPRGELSHQQRLAAEIRSRTSPADPVLLWGMHPETYWLSGRPPSSRYLTAGFLTNFSGGRNGVRVGERYAMDGAWPYFRGELTRRPPALVVDDSRGKPYGVEHVPRCAPI